MFACFDLRTGRSARCVCRILFDVAQPLACSFASPGCKTREGRISDNSVLLLRTSLKEIP